MSDASFDVSSSTKNSGSINSKLVSKLKKLVLEKDNKRSKVSSFEDMNERRNSADSISSCISVENASTNQRRKPRPSLDVQRMRLDLVVQESIAEHCRSDLGTSCGHVRMISEDCLSDLGDTLDHEDAVVREKVKLKKIVGVLKG